ncbi:MAG TPA: cohesin domain-containing protein [Bryobacteraceae bacterium]|nr:cohesin domain-containing protein [Bryobacteraceae bacterium]HPU71928.1 cohesin domain-containing protein [Bryobacteraceae bacterium]
MHIRKRSAIWIAAVALVLATCNGIDARTKKGDKFFNEGRKAEQSKQWDKALELYENALAEDPNDVGYQMAVRRVRFQAAQAHVQEGQKLRESGQLEQALAEFQKAYAMDPSSAVAIQEIRETVEMIERNKKAAERGAELPPEARKLTAAELARQQELERISRIQPPPELKPLSRQPLNLRMSNQPPRVLFETVGKLAGINVLFDPDYRNDPNAQRPASIELNNSTLEDALNYLSVITKSFWKPLSENAILVTNDNQAKRRDYEESVVKVFYLSNLTTPQELQEITTTLRTVGNLRKVFTYNALNAIVVRGTTDEVRLAEKLVADLDKPKAEVVVDVIVMEASKNKTRDLAATIASQGVPGINAPILFTPRNPVLLGGDDKNGDGDGDGNPNPSSVLSGIGSLSAGKTQQLISLARIGRISTNDFSITLPGALLQAMMQDSQTKILQSPQVRAANGQKAILRIGDKVPIASGGVQPFGGTGIGYGSLYSQFQFVDVGVNVDVTPIVHGDKEVTLKTVLEISSVRDRIDIGGISQPIIGQRKIELELRLREGEVSLLGGLMQDQDSKSVSGVPGLMNVPGLGRLFSSHNTVRSSNELLIALVPHIVRTPGITDVNLRPVAAGNDTFTKLSFAPPQETQPPAPEEAKPAAPAPAPAAPAQQPGAPAQEAPQAAQPAPQPDGALRLSLRPPVVQPQVGGTFTIVLEAENARDLFAAPFRLKFDPQVLRLNEIQAGGLLGGDGQKIIFTRNILNDTGDATVNLNRMPGTGGVSGSGTLAVFTFQALKPGNATITFTDLTPRNSQLQPIQVSIPQAVVNVK